MAATETSPTATASGAAPDIRFEGVTKRFGDMVAVDALDLDIPKGTFFALLGPSGCGKTTSLRMIGGFEEPSEGRVFLAGQDVTDVPPFRRDVNTVFQSYALFPHLDVERNIAFGLERKKVDRAEAKRRVGEILELAQLTELRKRKPAQLSGGQQQRVALARALVNRPQALLLDEPLGALDLRLRRQLQIELKRIHDEVGLTFVHVTHDQEEAMTMADEIAVMNAGRIEQRGSATELYEQPATEFVAGFLGTSNLIDAKLVSRDGGLAQYETHDGATVYASAAVEGDVRVGVRPEKLTIVDTAPEGCNTLRGRIEVASFLGVSLQYLVRTPGGEELTVMEQNNGASGSGGSRGPGQDVLLAWRHEHTFVVTKEKQ